MIVPEKNASPLNICVIGKPTKTAPDISLDEKASGVQQKPGPQDVVLRPDRSTIVLVGRKSRSDKPSKHDLP